MKFLIGIHIGQFAGAVFLGMVSMSAILNTIEEHKIITRLVNIPITDLSKEDIREI